MTIRRTKQGIILEKLLHGMKNRYVLCWNGEDNPEWGAYDCACCITYIDGEDMSGCGCVCHHRIEQMAHSPLVNMFLLALAASEEMPFVPKNYEDQMRYSRKIKLEHDQWRVAGNPSSSPVAPKECCENCKLVIQQEERHEEHQKSPKEHHREGESCFICDEIAQASTQGA